MYFEHLLNTMSLHKEHHVMCMPCDNVCRLISCHDDGHNYLQRGKDDVAELVWVGGCLLRVTSSN